MQRSPLTNSTVLQGDDVLVRNPPFTGPMVSITTLGGGGSGSSYDDTQVRALISQNTAAIATKHPAITVLDSNGASHSGVTTISAAGGSVSGTTLSLPTQVGPQGVPGDDGQDGAQGLQGPQGVPGNDGQDGAQGLQGIQGVPGNDGQDGAQGPQGIQGVPGNDGQDGAQGPQGIQGVPGNDGSDGSDATVQIDINGTGVPLSKITFSNHTVTLGSSTGEYAVLATPTIANIPTLTSELAAKALASSVYSKTETQGLLNTKANSGDLLQINTTGSSYSTITHLAVAGASVSLNGSAASITPAWPTIAQVENGQLTSQLAAKADNVDLYPEIWVSSGNTYQRLSKLYFSNFEYPLTVGLNSNAEGYGAWRMHCTPALEDISDITVTSTTVDFGKTLTVPVQNDPGPGTEDTLMWFKTGSYSHRMTGKFDTGANSGNFLRWYVRNASGGLQAALQIRGDSAIVGWGTFYIPTIYCSGTCTAQSYITTSDQSVKNDVEDVDLTPVFDRCNVKSYNRTDKPELGKRVGFLSQDIKTASDIAGLPNTFTNDIEQEDGTTLLGLDYGRLTTVLWSKVKQLESRLRTIELAIENA